VQQINKMKVYLFLLAGIASSSYSQRIQYTIPRIPWSVNFFDVDLDGDIDIVVGHKTTWLGSNPTLSILTNTGHGYFILSDTSKSYSGYQEDIFTCNIDNDGFQDIVTFYSDFSTGTADRYLRIWFNENGFINEFKDFSLNSSSTFSGISYGDINGDNHTDILVISNNDQFWGVLYNNGDGVLSSPEYFNTSNYYPLDIASGDLNGDGRDDVAVCGQEMEVYYSYQTGFQKITFPDAQKSMLDIIDFDGDGNKDIVSAADLSLINITSLVIYRNQADTNLEALPEVHFSKSSSDFCIKDFNNDGLPDVAFLSYFPYQDKEEVHDTIGGIYILYNLGAFQMDAPKFILLNNFGELHRNFQSADLDGNGYNDFIIVRTFYDNVPGNLEILYNDGKGSFVNAPLGVESPLQILNLVSLRCFPNPFFDFTTFEFELRQTAQVELSVYDLQGKIIQCLIHQKLKGGQYSIRWCGLDMFNKLCKPGIYFVFLKSNGHLEQIVKLIKY
jgi:hypothetical protein